MGGKNSKKVEFSTHSNKRGESAMPKAEKIEL
jgi:hypothetical protein